MPQVKAAFEALLGPLLGPCWGPVGVPRGSWERLLEAAGTSLGPSWAKLAPFASIWALSGPQKGPKRGQLQAIWDHLGPPRGPPRGHLGSFWAPKRLFRGSCGFQWHRHAQEVPDGLLQPSLGSTCREPTWSISHAVFPTLWSNFGTSALGL